MVRYLGKCKEVVGEIAVVGVRTRARAALAMAATATAASGGSTLPEKKIKKNTAAASRYNVRRIDNSVSSLSNVRIKTTSSSSSDVIVEVPANCPASCCSSNIAMSSNEIGKDRSESEIVANQEVESGQKSSLRLNCDVEVREENKADIATSDNLDSPEKLSNPESTMTPIKVSSSNSEMEQFFTNAEKEIQKRFTEKYNFDIVKDVPLEGRYEWVPIKP